MKTILKTSIVLNVLLAVYLIGHLSNNYTPRNIPAPTLNSVEAKISKTATKSAAANYTAPFPSKAQKSFQWSQLESEDYRTYIQNLRNIGCPEPTLLAIVTADVGAIYRKKNDALEQKLESFEKLSWSEKLNSSNLRQQWLAERQKLPGEEQSEIERLLGLQKRSVKPSSLDGVSTLEMASLAGSTSTSSGSTATSQMASIAQGQTSVIGVIHAGASDPGELSQNDVNLLQGNSSHPPQPVLPFVFKNPDPEILKLTEQQVEIVNNLRQTFVDEIGGLDQDPASPDYLERWLKAQTDIDNLAKGYLGVLPWENYQIATWGQP